MCSILLPSGYVGVMQLVCSILLPSSYVGAAYVLKISNTSNQRTEGVAVNNDVKVSSR